MRIVHQLAPAAFGGLERVVEMLALAQRAAGHEVHVVVSIGNDPGEHPFSALLRRHQIDVVEMRASGYRAEYRELQDLFARLKPDVVHTHGYRSDVLAGLAARRDRIARVSTAHGFTGGGFKGQLYEWVQRLGWRMHHAVIAVSQPLVVKLTAAGLGKRVQLLPNGWGRSGPARSREESRATLGLAAETTRLIGWMGRLSREKGADVMVATVPHLPADSALVMVGDGPERAAVEAQAAQLGVADRIRWLGLVPEAGQYIPAFDAFVMSSRTEGTPIVLFEAMAARVPIVVTRVGGIPDVVTEREAILVPSEDPAALGAAITRVFAESAPTAGRVRSAAQRLEQQYGVENWIRKQDEIYRAAIAVAR